MSEAKNNTILNQYLREMRMYCYYELKIAKGDRLQFSKIEVHQDESLPALAKEGLVWKFSDEDSRKKPCDGGCFPPLPSYLVIKFGDRFCFINYFHIVNLRNAGEKGISLEQALFLAEKVIHIRH